MFITYKKNNYYKSGNNKIIVRDIFMGQWSLQFSHKLKKKKSKFKVVQKTCIFLLLTATCINNTKFSVVFSTVGSFFSNMQKMCITPLFVKIYISRKSKVLFSGRAQLTMVSIKKK